jgi:hypothetical protein
MLGAASKLSSPFVVIRDSFAARQAALPNKVPKLQALELQLGRKLNLTLRKHR